jgi:hypothetical protein
MTFDELADIAHGWLAAFDEASECDALLFQKGFRAHHIFQNYLRRFSRGPDDVAIHEKCFVESSKERASRPLPLPFMGGDRSKFYRSDFLQSEIGKLAIEYGVEDTDEILRLHPGQLWRVEPDPLVKERTRMAYMECAVYDQLYDGVREQLRAQIEVEAARYSRGEPGSFLPQGRLDAFERVSQEALDDLGFRRARTRQKHYVAFDRPMSSKLLLRWSMENSDFFCPIR